MLMALLVSFQVCLRALFSVPKYKTALSLCNTLFLYPYQIHSEHKYEIVKKLQGMGHICGMTGDGMNDVLVLKKADIGITVADATEAARAASDIVLTEPGLSVIINAVLTSRVLLQQMNHYTVSVHALIKTTQPFHQFHLF